MDIEAAKEKLRQSPVAAVVTADDDGEIVLVIRPTTRGYPYRVRLGLPESVSRLILDCVQ